MKKWKKQLVIFAVLLGIALLIWSFFHVSGSEIEGVAEISADCTVTVEKRLVNEEPVEVFELDAAQIEALRELLLTTNYTRSFANAVYFQDRELWDIRVEFPDGEDVLRIHCAGNEYISLVEQFDGKHLKIRNPDWKASLYEILGIE